MEQKILEKLDKMDAKIDRIEARVDGMEAKFDELRVEIKEEIAKSEEKLRAEFKQESASLKEELRSEYKRENQKMEKRLEDRLIERMKQEVLDYMFVFESDYGRKINIMYEELMARNEKTEALEKSIIALERRVDKNSAFIFHYESQNATLEKTKH